jgi:hypothetical protein
MDATCATDSSVSIVGSVWLVVQLILSRGAARSGGRSRNKNEQPDTGSSAVAAMRASVLPHAPPLEQRFDANILLVAELTLLSTLRYVSEIVTLFILIGVFGRSRWSRGAFEI